MSAEIMDRIRAGDESALGELLDQEWTRLVRFLSRRVAPDTAADLAQEAMVRLWERRESWTEDSSARALLYRIATNAAGDLERRAAVRRRWGREQSGVPTTAPPTPHEELEAAEARARFAAALDELPNQRAEVFRLVRFEALSYREVADVLGLAPQTVANHMSLALRQLKYALADLVPSPATGPRLTDRTRSTDG